MPKATTPISRKPKQALRHNPLSDDIVATGTLKAKSHKRKAKQEDGQEDGYIDSKSSRKILRIGQKLVDEEQEAGGRNVSDTALTFESRLNVEDSIEEDYHIDEEDAWGEEDEDISGEAEMKPGDLDLFNRFMAPHEDDVLPMTNGSMEEDKATNLADLILERIAAHEAAQLRDQVNQGGDLYEDAMELPAKVVEVYSKIGLLLSRYKSGKLPKPFKIIPTMPRWEEILAFTRPESWSPNACYEATRIFVASKPHIVQRYLEFVVLDRVREDIHETKKLNVHLYNTLKKSLYKPAAFFKGFLFPLVTSDTCTLREAHIISSVLIRVSIPVLHSAAALLRLTEIAAEQTMVATENAGAANIFIRVLLEKKYALPYKVIDGLVFHFLRYRVLSSDPCSEAISGNLGAASRDLKLPVLWHQCLLAFAQRYRNEITEDQREALLDLLLLRGHHAIGPEIQRELLEGRGRGVPVETGGIDGGDDTMVLVPVQ